MVLYTLVLKLLGLQQPASLYSLTEYYYYLGFFVCLTVRALDEQPE